MKKYVAIFILLGLIISCKKGEKDPAPVETYTDKVVLNKLDIQGNTVKLSWSKLDTDKAYKYEVLRRDFDGADFYPIGEQILLPKETTETVDMTVPYSPNVSYQVRVRLSSSTISSNIVNYQRPDITLLDLIPFDAFYHPTDKSLYIFERGGRISIYDLNAQQLTKQIDTRSVIGFPIFETYQGREELYVPRNDGWVFVYDAKTLEKVDQISTGIPSTSVVLNNDTLFVSTDDSGRKHLKLYNRITKQFISEAAGDGFARLKKIPDSNTKLLAITLNVSPVQLHYYQFDNQELIEGNAYDLYHENYDIDASIFEFFPDGKKYISSSNGAIYNIDLSRDKYLPRGDLQFRGFAFNQQGDLIYGASTTKSIEVYSAQGLEHIKSIPTKAYPFKIFVTDDAVISLGLASVYNGYINTFDSYGQYGDVNKVLIEILDK
ncbi:YncE family protein [Parapedobacter lycopersici]|uniref:YncE family protein n=1 Tax=Parapedobacter lycopersici TaxID=1864939 RepID=UPI00214D2E99|nr:hypothetical protein [Parapedobacter lycopersici]